MVHRFYFSNTGFIDGCISYHIWLICCASQVCCCFSTLSSNFKTLRFLKGICCPFNVNFKFYFHFDFNLKFWFTIYISISNSVLISFLCFNLGFWFPLWRYQQHSGTLYPCIWLMYFDFYSCRTPFRFLFCVLKFRILISSVFHFWFQFRFRKPWADISNIQVP